MSATDSTLLKTPLHALHVELGARLVPFAAYAMPVQYPAGLMAEHHHTRTAASLFDVSHMGQLRLVGPDAAAALETLMPVDVLDLAVGKQRYGLLLNDEGGIIDDLMFFNRDYANSGDPSVAGPPQDARAPLGGREPHAVGDRGGDIFIIVNGACKVGDIAHIQAKIGSRCEVIPLPDLALLALQGPQAVTALARLAPGVEKLVFMTGGHFKIAGCDCFLTRSGYTGEDGFEISVPAAQAETLARALLAQPEVKPAGLGARNSLRLEAGLCLYGNDLDTSTTPVEAGLNWAIQKVRRSGGARAGGFPGADKVLAQLANPASLTRKRVGLIALERVPVREHTELQNTDGQHIGEVSSGLLGPTIDQPIAMAYVAPAYTTLGTRVNAIVRGKAVAMEVAAMPFVPNRYFRG
ncbi:glycine cleavage system aminomethyltransferase GcvT [Polaromonas sp. SM01]|uniref:glycine cleavage system aminomethyltransferase GcvT n=1 Tax=Polaromonas sp. SM01 TaxID=3085630 RepID=UPI002982A544|nr:glycine cleavage system aminomethyltransferase GcvT [Polaromonas sp. SM01]MDW5444494.1 glycine cleavage system aminomethyltransferase GcvT [Polaromonas sp. SM01]